MKASALPELCSGCPCRAIELGMRSKGLTAKQAPPDAKLMKQWALMLKARGHRGSVTQTNLSVALAPEDGATNITLLRATDGRAHLFSALGSGRERPFENTFDEVHWPALYELAGRFNSRRWFELLDVVQPGKMIYKVLLLTGFRGEERPSDDLVATAIAVHRDRLRVVAKGVRDLVRGATLAASLIR